jgi:hypothetical protein
MIVMLKTQGLQSLEQIRAFLEGSQPLGIEVPAREAAYDWMAAELRRFGYTRLGKADKGLVRHYLEKVTGLSRAQTTRLITQFRNTGRIHDRRGKPAKPFARRYTTADVRLLAELDVLHGTLSGPATRKLCERAYAVFDDVRYQRLGRYPTATSTTCATHRAINGCGAASTRHAQQGRHRRAAQTPPPRAAPAS